ncbi:hypothetical protein P8C59_000762 [Phyllachora maydis]|uniref:2,5-diamino-6-ribosylamino-4(3H)-pyrimidinone 5'-phosphate reductase n=1 Tax=Phyllachora maydis TaxID=1825666 RepID=A0AAD9HWX2_9PEZI|nr:hypothetical protein P8C59_000762 [Phyllachora maydis]
MQPSRPFVTLTFATSLDASLALAPGTRTALSGPQSKAMTHFLRRRHAAICVGVGTIEADDPGLNCRLAADHDTDGDRPSPHQPRPIVLDPGARWAVSEDNKVIRLAREGRGLAPFVITARGSGLLPPPPADWSGVLQRHGGKYITIPAHRAGDEVPPRFRWAEILAAVRDEGLTSIMIEGGGQVINSLLDGPDNGLVDSVIVTIAPTWLGQGGVVVSPARVFDAEGKPKPAVRLEDVEWIPLGEDVVLCGRIQRCEEESIEG